LPVAIGLLVVFVVGAFLMLRSTGPVTPTIPTVPGSPTTTAGSSSTTIVTKAQVRVQVANGTSTTGLARTYTQNLMTLGWDTLPEMNGPKVTSTVVYYNPGFRWAALEIATSINVSSSAVQPLGGLTPVPGAQADDVVVILGPDVAIKG
jgi:LytR cell envelope-related transcriptional attenuator